MKQPEKEKPVPDNPAHEKPAEAPAGIVQPMIDELRCPKDAPTPPQGPPRRPVHPPEPEDSPEPAELDQDPGGGYNPDHTFPQP